MSKDPRKIGPSRLSRSSSKASWERYASSSLRLIMAKVPTRVKAASVVGRLSGGDSGIGRAIAIAFAREGADIILSHLPEEEADAPVVKSIVAAAGRKILRMPGDIRSRQYAESLVTTALEQFGRLDILVNNAATQRRIHRLMRSRLRNLRIRSERTCSVCLI